MANQIHWLDEALAALDLPAWEAQPRVYKIATGQDGEGLLEGLLAKIEAHYSGDPLFAGLRSIQDLPVADIVGRAAEAGSDGEALAELTRGFVSKANVTNRWSDESAPERRNWLVQNWLPAGRIGLISGIGGGGKSRLAIQLCCAVASGDENWLPASDGYSAVMGAATGEAANVVMASWEDEPSEANRRRYWMQRKGCLSFAEAKRLQDRWHWLDMRSHGPAWGPAESGSKHTSTISALYPAGRMIRRYCESVSARLLVLDPLAACYASSENERGLVRAFMADWDAWAEANQCAVAIISHPAKAKDSAYAGSTDWLGASRWLWTMGLPDAGLVPVKGGKGNDKAKPLELTLEKSNYSRQGQTCYLRSRGNGAAWEQCSKEQSAQAQASRFQANATANASAGESDSEGGDDDGEPF